MVKEFLTSLIKSAIKKDVKTSKESSTQGKRGEIIACKSIKRNGYKVIEKNFRTRFSEIDIIAEDKECVCFIEVKSRSSIDYGYPEEFVTKDKQERIIRAALIYVGEKNLWSKQLRFDVISINLETEEIRLMKDAFEVVDKYL